MVGNNNPYTTENTRNQGETTVGEEMIGGWQVTPTVGFLCFLVFSDVLLFPFIASCFSGRYFDKTFVILFTFCSKTGGQILC